jgi:hypothetical protein
MRATVAPPTAVNRAAIGGGKLRTLVPATLASQGCLVGPDLLQQQRGTLAVEGSQSFGAADSKARLCPSRTIPGVAHRRTIEGTRI